MAEIMCRKDTKGLLTYSASIDLPTWLSICLPTWLAIQLSLSDPVLVNHWILQINYLAFKDKKIAFRIAFRISILKKLTFRIAFKIAFRISILKKCNKPNSLAL